MSRRPPKVSAEGIIEIRAWYAARSNLATPGEMRRRHKISTSSLSKICRGLVHKVKR